MRKMAFVFIECILELHRGQGMELYWRDKFICPSEGNYFEMIRKKTGGLYLLGIRLMQLLSNNCYDLNELTLSFGELAQIRNDYMNFMPNTVGSINSFI